MSALARRSLTLLAVVVACVLPFGSAQASGDSGDNVATANITQDDGRAFDFAWDVYKQNGDDPVLNRNEADAAGQCTRCKATAIAFQILLVHGSPNVVVPQNIATALSDQCTECQVVAEARQFVRVSPDRLRVNGEGRQILQDVRRDLAALEDQDLPADQLHAAVEAEEARVREVLATDLVVASDPEQSPTFDTRRVLQAVDLD
jgi:putative peptide zinc metalloprotease protein